MTEALIDHVWQSTGLALAAALLVLTLRNNSASVRFRIWLAASLKFLVPLPLFVLIGRHLPWHAALPEHPAAGMAVLLKQLAEPGSVLLAGFEAPLGVTGVPTSHSQWSLWAHAHWSPWTSLLIVWAVGFATLLCRRSYQWVQLNSIAWSSSPLAIEAPLPVRQTGSKLEPGIFGIFWPVLLLPEGIAARLAPEQLETIIAHELHHWRRKDNLTASLHMIVESLFWFHPLVWWLGQRMLVERERAVDEAVIHSGSDRQVYAEGILKVCQFYVEPPLPCTAGVSGGTLRKRIEEIMTNRTLLQLHFAKKCLLCAAAAVGVGGPIAIGLLSPPYTTALAQQPGSADAVEMQHYQNTQWNFGLDIPKRWNAFPAVPTNSPYELIRFESRESGEHGLIVFRSPYDPQMSSTAFIAGVEESLTKHGLGNFVPGEATIGAQQIMTLDFDRTDAKGKTWSSRQYYFINGTVVYVLGFVTTNKEAMFPLYDKMAQTFVSQK